MDAQIAPHAVGVEDVQRPVPVIGQEIGDIDQRRDRAQADGAQPVLQPFGARAVAHTPDEPAGEEMTAALTGVLVDADADGARETAFDMDIGCRPEHARSARGQIARDAAHAERVGAVGGDRDLDHRVDPGRVMHGKPVDEALAHLARRQLDDAVMLVGEFHLALGTHHAVALDAADAADTDGRVDPWHIHAGARDHHGDALTRIRGATDDLRLTVGSQHLADLEAIGIGVFLRLQHLADGELGQPRGGVGDAFDLESEIGQCLGDLLHRSVGVEVILQPGKGEFHRVPSAGYMRSKGV